MRITFGDTNRVCAVPTFTDASDLPVFTSYTLNVPPTTTAMRERSGVTSLYIGTPFSVMPVCCGFAPAARRDMTSSIGSGRCCDRS